MTGHLPPTASVAEATEGMKLNAPSALRNVDALTDLLLEVAPTTGTALELASGTGQHLVAFAQALPGLTWHPSDLAADRRASIDAYRWESACANIAPASALNACASGWSRNVPAQDLIVCINLLHLVSDPAAQTLVLEAGQALAPGGTLMLYGPFKRDGQLTSDGDARFDAQLRAADAAIGYKDDSTVSGWLAQAGLASAAPVPMPANNLAFVGRKPR